MTKKPIQMVDLHGQYLRLKQEIDASMQSVIDHSAFINGPQVHSFADHLATYLDVPYVTTCGNGTDALQIALMALGLQPGDEVIIPAFTYVAAAEVVALLGLQPVLVDVLPETFNIDPTQIAQAISSKTKAIIVVHLFGQVCNMQPIMDLAEAHHLYVIEDNAQSLGAEYLSADGHRQKAGTIGHIGTTSFFPSKPLACYGDGGALMTRNEILATRIQQIANHGQEKKYLHKRIGCNSRLDTLQAAVLDVKLQYLDAFAEARRQAAHYYDQALAGVTTWETPVCASYSTHVYHQYTLRVQKDKRADLQRSLKEDGIPSMIYYPLPIHKQEAYQDIVRKVGDLEISTELCHSVLSLPIHTEMDEEMLQYITDRLLYNIGKA